MPASAEDSDRRHMGAALSLARRGLGTVWPNPAVGCVLVTDGHVVGRGWTQPGGRPHAETMAIAQAGTRAKGATAYVSLEPCAHHGKTPPCADALVRAGITRVVSPMQDPDPRVAGKGFDRLRAAGIAVEVGGMAAEAASVNCGFLSRQTRGRPWLTLKLAATLDGRIATATGESRWITGPAARAHVHLMRAEADAILIGAGTARADDPNLDVRLEGLSHRAPIRVVADSGLSMTANSKLAQSATEVAPVWRLCREGAAGWGDLLPVAATADGRLDLSAALTELGTRGITRVLCEGGGTFAAALLQAGLVDELVWIGAGSVLGADGTPAIGTMGIGSLADTPKFSMTSCRTLGPDLMSIWRPA